MKSLNKVYLLGNLGHNPDLMVSKGGKPYTRLSIATHYSRKDVESGEFVDQTEWHSIMVWGKQAEHCADQLKKGAMVFVEGYLNSYKAEIEGDTTMKRIGITAERVTFFRSKPVRELLVERSS